MLKVFFRSRCWGFRQGHEAAAVRILYVLHSEQPGVGRTLIRSWLAPLSSTGASSETKSQQSPDAVTLTAPCFYGLINSLFQTGFGWPRGIGLLTLPSPVCVRVYVRWGMLGSRLCCEGWRRALASFLTQNRLRHCLATLSFPGSANTHTHTKPGMAVWDHHKAFCFIVAVFLLKFTYRTSSFVMRWW